MAAFLLFDIARLPQAPQLLQDYARKYGVEFEIYGKKVLKVDQVSSWPPSIYRGESSPIPKGIGPFLSGSNFDKDIVVTISGHDCFERSSDYSEDDD